MEPDQKRDNGSENDERDVGPLMSPKKLFIFYKYNIFFSFGVRLGSIAEFRDI